MTEPNNSTWQPPGNFQPVSSALDGVSVYAPQPEKEAPQEPVSYKCPNCGATTRYDVSAGGIACEYCGFTAPVRAEQVGTQADQFEFTLDTLGKAETGWGTERSELHCDSCGANLAIAPGALSTTCPFCGSNEVNIRHAPTDVLRPRYIIPFRILSDELRARTAEWLGKGWYHPKELKIASVIDRYSGIYMPYWTFDAQVDARWKAEVGHEQTDRYYDGGDREWKTRVKIEWRWETGQVSLTHNDLLIRGSQRLSKHLLDQVQYFNLEELSEYSPDFLAGWQALTYDISLTDAWEDGKETMREQARDACYSQTGSPHVRNFSMIADFANETWRFILLPVYLSTYRFTGKNYTVLANGQSGAIAGQKPVEWSKVWLVILAMLAPGIIIGLFGLPLLLLGGAGLVPIFIALVWLVIAGVIAANIYRQAVASEAP